MTDMTPLDWARGLAWGVPEIQNRTERTLIAELVSLYLETNHNKAHPIAQIAEVVKLKRTTVYPHLHPVRCFIRILKRKKNQYRGRAQTFLLLTDELVKALQFQEIRRYFRIFINDQIIDNFFDNLKQCEEPEVVLS